MLWVCVGGCIFKCKQYSSSGAVAIIVKLNLCFLIARVCADNSDVIMNLFIPLAQTASWNNYESSDECIMDKVS